nr:beta-defensin 115 [Peromyscus maniculatus bairdii]
MLRASSLTLSGHIKLCFLTLAVFMILAHTSPEGWLKTCFYGLGKCRRECRSNEKKKEICGDSTICCLHISKSKLSNIPLSNTRKKNEDTGLGLVSTRMAE